MSALEFYKRTITPYSDCAEDTQKMIEDFFASKFIVMKQEEYDALPIKDPTVFYCIEEEDYKGTPDEEPEE